MNKKNWMLLAWCLITPYLPAQNPDTVSVAALKARSEQPAKPIESDGLFFADATQTKLYTGGYKEFYDNGELKLEMMIVQGKPEGPYVVYFQNGRPNEVRSYHDGKFHGVWRTYNENGMLISQAEYLENKKHGRWMV
ncbi:MAG: hypothetical protein NTY32_05470, partial [Bacteroidia bacterium]|nr:hypothetical protein [Bacteroidia bacterium]